jgi:hypothetical protein
MKGLILMLKAFGLSDSDLEKIRVFLPQVPSVAQNAITTVNRAVADFDVRLKTLERGQTNIEEQLGVATEVLSSFLSSQQFTAERESIADDAWMLKTHELLEEILDGIRTRNLQQSDSPGVNGSAVGPIGGAHSGADSHSSSARSSGTGGRRRGSR